MWSRATPVLLAGVMVAACATAQPSEGLAAVAPPEADTTHLDVAVPLIPPHAYVEPDEFVAYRHPLPAGKENTIFAVEAAEAGALRAFFRNDEGLGSPALEAKFSELLRRFCGGEITFLQGRVIITADERVPSRFTEGLFRCGGAQQ